MRKQLATFVLWLFCKKLHPICMTRFWLRLCFSSYRSSQLMSEGVFLVLLLLKQKQTFPAHDWFNLHTFWPQFCKNIPADYFSSLYYDWFIYGIRLICTLFFLAIVFYNSLEKVNIHAVDVLIEENHIECGEIAVLRWNCFFPFLQVMSWQLLHKPWLRK